MITREHLRDKYVIIASSLPDAWTLWSHSNFFCAFCGFLFPFLILRRKLHCYKRKWAHCMSTMCRTPNRVQCNENVDCRRLERTFAWFECISQILALSNQHAAHKWAAFDANWDEKVNNEQNRLNRTRTERMNAVIKIGENQFESIKCSLKWYAINVVIYLCNGSNYNYYCYKI